MFRQGVRYLMHKALTEGHQVQLTLKTINSQEFMALALNACRQLGWRIAEITEESALLYTNGSAVSYEEEIRVELADTTAVVRSRSVSEYLYDQQQNINNILAFRNALNILHSNYLQQKQGTQKKNTPTISPFHMQTGWGALFPSRRHIISPVLIYLNVLVLLVMALAGISPIDPKARELITWGGNFQPLILEGQYWRLFTYMFLHGGLGHLAGNVFAILYIGLHLEPFLGRRRYLSAYLLTGIVAGVTSMVVHNHSVGVGASGAIFGLYGVFLSLLVSNVIKGTIRQTLLRSLLFFVVYSLMMGIQGNTDNAAHIGGLLSGMAIGAVYITGLKNGANARQQWKTVTYLTTITLAMAGAVIYHLEIMKGA